VLPYRNRAAHRAPIRYTSAPRRNNNRDKEMRSRPCLTARPLETARCFTSPIPSAVSRPHARIIGRLKMTDTDRARQTLGTRFRRSRRRMLLLGMGIVGKRSSGPTYFRDISSSLRPRGIRRLIDYPRPSVPVRIFAPTGVGTKSDPKPMPCRRAWPPAPRPARRCARRRCSRRSGCRPEPGGADGCAERRRPRSARCP
jgi:hypothetical protein